MIKNIKICDIVQVKWELLRPSDDTAWIASVDPEDEKEIKSVRDQVSRAVKCLNLNFRDLDDSDHIADIDGPTKYDAELAIGFLGELKNDVIDHNILVNCYAGVSRSAAIAVAGWVISGKSPEEAYRTAFNSRRYIRPNPRMLRLFDEILGTNMASVVKGKEEELSKKIIV